MGFLSTFLCFSVILASPIPSSAKADSIALWCRQGNICIEEGNGEKAAEYYKKCSDEVGTGTSMVTLTVTLQNLGKIYSDAGDYEEALKYIKRSISLGKVIGNTGSFALRYLEASNIYSVLGDNEKAEEYARKGLETALEGNNENTIGQLLLRIGDLEREKGNVSVSDSLYKQSLPYFYRRGKGKIFVPQAYAKLGKNAKDKGDISQARYYFECMLDSTRFGYDHDLMYEGCKQLEDLLKDISPEESAIYAAKADSLSFVPAMDSLFLNLALCNIEFPRRERELLLASAKQKAAMFLIIAILFLLLCVLLLFSAISHKKAQAESEKKNAELLQASIQKDKLIALARAAAASEEKIHDIEIENADTPDVKLSKREIEVAKLCAEGYQSKEIADRLNISPRTVGVHKSNIFRKLGINNTIELLRCLQKLNL